MSPQELLKYCYNELPSGVIENFLKILDNLEFYEMSGDSDRRTIEIKDEQIYYAQNLIASILEWSEENLPKTKQKQLQKIVNVSMFEL